MVVLKVQKIVYSEDVFSRVTTLYSKAKTIELYAMGPGTAVDAFKLFHFIVVIHERLMHQPFQDATSNASIIPKLYPFYTLWGIAFSRVFDYYDTQKESLIEDATRPLFPLSREELN